MVSQQRNWFYRAMQLEQACFFAPQNFWQRTQNYLQLILLRWLVVPSLMAPINGFIKEEGLNYPPLQSGWQQPAASIAVGDWALEFPYPLPPSFHVSRFCSVLLTHLWRLLSQTPPLLGVCIFALPWPGVLVSMDCWIACICFLLPAVSL